MSSKLTVARSAVPDEPSADPGRQLDPLSQATSALTALLGGPYHSPDVQVGDRIRCEYRRQEVVVKGFSSAPIPWPSISASGNYGTIVCGDLEKALWVESTPAVARAWGRSQGAVRLWRRTLAHPSANGASQPKAVGEAPVSGPTRELDANSPLPLLAHGPYRAPEVQLGDRLWCLYRRREVVVQVFSTGPIPWPCVRYGKTFVHIFCGDLARAVALESSPAVKAWWNLTQRYLVGFRVALGLTAPSDPAGQWPEQVSRQFLDSEGQGEAALNKSRPQFSLLYGHYQAPRVKVGDTLYCSLRRQDVKVSDWSSGPLPWPCAFTNNNSHAIILCGDLERAARFEPRAAVAFVWNVSPSTVSTWRGALRNSPRGLNKSIQFTDQEPPSPVPLNSTTGQSEVLPAADEYPLGQEVALPRVLSGLPTLVGGPYRAPDVQVGDILRCEYRGVERMVSSMTQGAIPWPSFRYPKNISPVVCGDLARAVRLESSKAVQEWWGVPGRLVSAWRRALGVATENKGTRQLRIASVSKCSAPDEQAGAMPPHHLAGERRKSGRFKASHPLQWTREHEKLLGTMPDTRLTNQWGCRSYYVGKRRRELAIPAYVPEGHDPRGHRYGLVAVDAARLKHRRQRAGLLKLDVAQLAGLSTPHYSRLENGEHLTCRRTTADRIARALECALDDILTDHPLWPVRDPEPRKRRRPQPSGPLLGGPYQPPETRGGEALYCNLRRCDVTVVDWTDAPTPWPRTQLGSMKSIILHGDLIKAIQTESMEAVALAWGVSVHLVNTWRLALTRG